MNVAHDDLSCRNASTFAQRRNGFVAFSSAIVELVEDEVGFDADRADQKLLAAEKELQARQKSFFLNALSHDLRAPLHNVLLNAHLLRTSVKDEADAEKAKQTFPARLTEFRGEKVEQFTECHRLGLFTHEEYVTAFRKAFNKEPAQITMKEVQQAIASFERTIVSGDSPFDRFYFGGDPQASQAEQAHPHLRSGVKCHGARGWRANQAGRGAAASLRCASRAIGPIWRGTRPEDSMTARPLPDYLVRRT